MYSYWAGPSQEEEGEEELFDEQDEDEACWVMKKMSRGHGHGGHARRQEEEEGGFEEGMQQLPEDDDLVMVVPTDYHYTSRYSGQHHAGTEEKRRMEMEDKVQPQHRMHGGHNEHQEEKSDFAACVPSSSSARRESMHSRRSDMQTPVPPSPHCPAYHATAEERLAWAHVQQQWENAGPSQREALIASLPTPVHEAWTGFFLVMAPFQTQAELIKACHSLLCTSPVLAVSVHQHRLALDPLAVASPDKTFLLQDEEEEGPDADTPSSSLSGSSQHTHATKSKVVAAGHNHRALRDVLGFGLNHLVESVHSLPKDDARPAAAALHECLEAWKGHTGRLL